MLEGVKSAVITGVELAIRVVGQLKFGVISDQFWRVMCVSVPVSVQKSTPKIDQFLSSVL